MADWKPIRPGRGGRDSTNAVRIAVHGALGQVLMFFSAEVMEKWGNPEHVVPMLNGNPSLLGIRVASGPVRGETLKLLPSNQSSRKLGATAARMSAKGTLEMMGKSLQPMEHVPHHWDGDVLVIDLSGLPDAQGGD